MAERPGLFLDENIPASVARGLRQRGEDVVHVEEAGLRGASDYLLIRIAASQGRIFVTRDVVDFIRLTEHFRMIGEENRGVLLVSRAFPPEAPGQLIDALVQWVAGASNQEDPLPGGFAWLPGPTSHEGREGFVREPIPRYVRALQRLVGV